MRYCISIFCTIIFSQCSRSKDSVIFVALGDSSITSASDSVYYSKLPFSGVIYDLSNDQDTLIRMAYYNGVKDGFQRKWHSDKQLAEERFYIQGRKEGVHKGWWPNGNQQFEFSISNDEYQNEFREWNEEGKLIKLFHYKNGHEEGNQQLWYNDGRVRANYIIKAGRRYGLLGTKNCINVSDSVFNK